MKDVELDLLQRFSKYLNGDLGITINQVNKVCKTGVGDKLALKLLLEEYLGENELFTKYYDEIVKELNPKDYTNDEYYNNVKIKNKKYLSWELKYSKYKPYELFVYDDFKEIDGYVIPQIGYFTKPFDYLGVYQDKRLWMSITPNEINTMKKPIENAKGNVLVFGMGLGYYQYMISNKKQVNKITIVEHDQNVIDLFNKIIFPFFKFKIKIEIVRQDAYAYLSGVKDKEFDYIFV
ncbi:MAG: hypothetical protein K5892_05205, partial [Acholeplasmatales bacterium]|nr:hypothetical protein [Acholeplasmatales bacterium]